MPPKKNFLILPLGGLNYHESHVPSLFFIAAAASISLSLGKNFDWSSRFVVQINPFNLVQAHKKLRR